MNVGRVSALVYGTRVSIPDGAKLTALPSGSILIVPAPNTTAHLAAIEVTPEGELRAHPALMEAGQ
jgi:hypothetical protein